MKNLGRYFDKENGWGTITVETEHFYIINWDRDPNLFEQVVKPEFEAEYKVN